ncbi:MAG: hypothetical protein H7836_00920 [Magnetococcus sp. YQC-3]
MKYPDQFFKRFQKKSKHGMRGYPMATLAFYGPDDRKATKVAVGIIATEGAEVDPLARWFSEEVDIRKNNGVGKEITDFIQSHEVKTIAMVERIMGCPHEEGKDYPDGTFCPLCPFWKERDRFTGERLY